MQLKLYVSPICIYQPFNIIQTDFRLWAFKENIFMFLHCVGFLQKKKKGTQNPELIVNLDVPLL